MTSAEPILVLGIGNYLMGDEGVGVHAISQLQKETFPEYVHLLDGGTGGFHLLSYLENYSSIVMIDATMDGRPAGTIKVIKPRFASDFPRALSAHDIGLRDLVESAALLGNLPETTLITISIDSLQNLSTDLTPLVQEALPGVSSMVKKVLEEKFLVQTNC
jgi:hydrogenase maturation protease